MARSVNMLRAAPLYGTSRSEALPQGKAPAVSMQITRVENSRCSRIMSLEPYEYVQ